MTDRKQKPDKPKPTPGQYQPDKAELEADVSIGCDPNHLLRSVINHKRSRRNRAKRSSKPQTEAAS